jgi:hypothetical protein
MSILTPQIIPVTTRRLILLRTNSFCQTFKLSRSTTPCSYIYIHGFILGFECKLNLLSSLTTNSFLLNLPDITANMSAFHSNHYLAFLSLPFPTDYMVQFSWWFRRSIVSSLSCSSHVLGAKYVYHYGSSDFPVRYLKMLLQLYSLM